VENVKKGTSVPRVLGLLGGGAVLAALIYFAPAYFMPKQEGPAGPVLKTGGTSNIEMILANRWRKSYKKANGVEVEYDSSGSTAGIQKLLDRQYAIAFSHAPLSDENRKQARGKDGGGELVQIPVVLCAVVPVYNVKELNAKPPVKFSGEVLADIFLGKIDRWSNKAIADLNPGVALPETPIVVVHREDSSGTTYIFADYLHGASPAWASAMGEPRSELKWPAGEVAKARSTGVAQAVQQTEGAIGYVDLLHVFHGQLPYGAVQTREDKSAYLQAKADAITAAARSLGGNVPDDLSFSLTNRPGKDAYPISGAIWAVCYRDQPAGQHKQVVDFLTWVLHDGQQSAAEMSYAPLPEELVKRAEERVRTIKAGP
jgi:phosphate transport system substrate-binding protein